MNAPIPVSALAPAARPCMPAQPVVVDSQGFLVDGRQWSAAVAAELAAAEGIETLGDRHWAVIHLVRQRYLDLGALPVMRLICRAAGVDRQQAHRLFGSCRSLWRVAGLPHPGDEALAYMT